MKILFESEVRAEPGRLDRAWSNPESFVLLPDKSVLTAETVTARCAGIPDTYRQGHFILLTSGSTGEPKLVIGERGRAEALARKLDELQDAEPVHSSICLLPLSYCYAFVNQWLWSRVAQRKLVLVDGFARADDLAAVLESTSASMLCLVGAQVPLIMQYFSDRVFPEVLRLHFAGGRFPQEQLDEIRKRFPNAVMYNNYGCAEAMPRLTLRKAQDGTEAADVGKPLPGVELRLDEDNGLCFQSVYSAVAFVDEAGFTAVDDTSWLATGDLAEELESGHWRILGRQGEVFKRFGEKISLSNLLKSVNDVWPHGAAFYKDQDSTGEDAHVLMLAPHPQKPQLREVLSRLRKDFPRTHWPLRVESVGELPRLPNGKTDGLALAQMSDKQEQWRQRL
ncbi:acyl--CoA ligase [Gammaproteobacteria bacterium]|nr:acyl--CoA ligase [Gammaproteobacteria bacterium]